LRIAALLCWPLSKASLAEEIAAMHQSAPATLANAAGIVVYRLKIGHKKAARQGGFQSRREPVTTQ
jgi:hypothetical protein